MSNQFSRKVIEKDFEMRQVDFHQIWDGWQCNKCNFIVEWNIRTANKHSETHKKITEYI